MASPVGPLFSDLRGVTVRNTFLEFEDVGTDNLPESGFTRQASEPAKPFHRQVSEQTTTGSGATLEESTTEPEEGYSQLASYLNAALPQAQQSQLVIPRFCPNCGMEAEPNHRFCPYCCYPLQPCVSNGAAGAISQPQCSVPVNVETGLNVTPSAPNLLAYLRRFRYVEACAADVELARVLCLNYMQTGKAA